MRKLFSLFALWAILLSPCFAQLQMDRVQLKGVNGIVYADAFSTIQSAITSQCPVAPALCWVIIPARTTDTTAVESLTTGNNVMVLDLRSKAFAPNDAHAYFGQNDTSDHDFELGATGTSTNGGEGPSFVCWNKRTTAAGNDRTCSIVGRWGTEAAPIYSSLIHFGWWDGSAWHPDMDILTNTTAAAGTVTPGRSRLRIGVTGATIHNPEVTANTWQLDPAQAISNNFLELWNQRVEVGGAYLGGILSSYWEIATKLRIGSTQKVAQAGLDIYSTPCGTAYGIILRSNDNITNGMTHQFNTDGSCNGELLLNDATQATQVTLSTTTASSFNKGIQVGSTGSTINADYKGSGTLTYTAIGANACQEQPLTITGAASGDVCFVSPAADIGANFQYGGCRVSGSNTAQVRVCSGAGGTPSAQTWNGWARH